MNDHIHFCTAIKSRRSVVFCLRNCKHKIVIYNIIIALRSALHCSFVRFTNTYMFSSLQTLADGNPETETLLWPTTKRERDSMWNLLRGKKQSFEWLRKMQKQYRSCDVLCVFLIQNFIHKISSLQSKLVKYSPRFTFMRLTEGTWKCNINLWDSI